MGWDVADSQLTTWVFPYPKHRGLLYNRVVLSRRIKLTIWTTRWICWYSITWCARRWLFFCLKPRTFSYFLYSSWIWGYPSRVWFSVFGLLVRLCAKSDASRWILQHLQICTKIRMLMPLVKNMTCFCRRFRGTPLRQARWTCIVE